MNERTKRILLIVGFILSVFIIAFVMFKMFFADFIPEPTVEDGDEVTTGTLPFSLEGTPYEDLDIDDVTTGIGTLSEADTVARGGVTSSVTLTTGSVYNTSISSDGDSMNYYDETDGRFYTIDEDGNVVLYEWDFDGDGSYDWSADDYGFASHNYEDGGTYAAVLRVTDDEGNTGTDSINVTVKELVSIDDEGYVKVDDEGIPAPSFFPAFASVVIAAVILRWKR